MLPRLVHLLDHLIPREGIATDPITHWRARLLLYFCLVLSTVATAFIPLFVWRGEWLMVLVLFASAVADLAPLLVLWRTRDVTAAGALPGIVGTIGLAGMALLQGGLRSEALYWAPVILIVAMLLGGRKGTFAAAALQLVTLLSLYVLHLADVPLPPLVAWPLLPRLFGIVALGFVTFELSCLFEVVNLRMRTALEKRNIETRVLLDNVGQGFLCADRHGAIVGDVSAVTERWFGAPPKDARLWTWLGGDDDTFTTAAELGWAQLWEDFLPIALCIDQLPKRIERGAQTFGVEYHPVPWDGVAMGRVALVLTDITDRLRVEQSEAQQKELANVLDRALRDRSGFHQFVAEVDAMFDHLTTDTSAALRIVHTIKGNCGMYGVRSVAERCHELEGRLTETGAHPSAEDIAHVRAAWEVLRGRVASVCGDRAGVIELDSFRYQALQDATRRQLPYEQLNRLVAALVNEPAGLPLERAAEHARSLATRLGHAPPEVHIDDGGLSLEPRIWEPFWAAFVHVVRNAVHHGTRPGQPGILHLSTRRSGAHILVEVKDEGNGIAWEHIRDRAIALGLPHETEAHLIEALFTDGLSAAVETNDVSGRGIGMGAFRETVRAMGGTLEVESHAGCGTRIRATLPGNMAFDATGLRATA